MSRYVLALSAAMLTALVGCGPSLAPTLPPPAGSVGGRGQAPGGATTPPRPIEWIASVRRLPPREASARIN